MTLLDEVVAAMDHADAARALAAVNAAFANDGKIPDTFSVAATTGQDAMGAVCEAFDLEAEEILAFAIARGNSVAEAMLRTAGVPPSPELLRFYGGMVGGGITIGFRVGLMIADRQAKGV